MMGDYFLFDNGFSGAGRRIFGDFEKKEGKKERRAHSLSQDS